MTDSSNDCALGGWLGGLTADDGWLAHARDQDSFLPLTVAIACPKARPRKGEQAIATVRGRKARMLGLGLC